jgi:two-component system C4-dicarboxylate transport response regulator DctD
VTALLTNTAVALVEDDEDLRRATAQLLGLAGCTVREFANASDALRVLDDTWNGVVVSDIRMPGMTGIEFFRRLRELDPELPVILITGHANVDVAVDALKAGAWDFLTKPFLPEVLLGAIERAARTRELVLDNRRLKADAEAEQSSALIGHSPAIARLREMIPALAQSDLDIVIEGETGTGKELFARLVHMKSKRSRHRLVTISCAGMPPAMEAELFAGSGRSNLLSAHRGTVLLDDLDLASAQLQGRLVPLIEHRHFQVAGDKDPLPLDMRVIATAGTQPGRLEDRIAPALFYRVAAVRITMPPLRDRREDILPLFAHHLAASAGRLRQPVPDMTMAMRDYLDAHDWPGNVRELVHFAERCVLGLFEGGGGGTRAAAPALPLSQRMDAFEREAILQAISEAGGEIGKAIEALGLARETFYYRVKKLGIDLTKAKGRKPRQGTGRGAPG